jgi:hypothetical protein
MLKSANRTLRARTPNLAFDKNAERNDMNTAALGPVWIHPPRFWSAVEGKSEDEIADLLDYMAHLLADGQTEALLRFDFVTGVGYPYPKSSGRMKDTEKPAV